MSLSVPNDQIEENSLPVEGEDEDDKLLNSVDEIESLCMNCGEDGVTRLMMHKIPYFRELIIASFRCEACGEYNNEVTFGGEIQLQGCVFELNLTCAADLDRQVIKSDSASLKIPSLDFEIPPLTQKGEISTLEGFLHTAAKNLSLYQEERLRQTPEIGVKVGEIINQLERMATGQASVFPFKVIVDDPSGNSFIQNPNAPAKDPHLRTGFYYRSPEQDVSLGLQPSKGLYKDDKDSNFKALITGPAFGDVKTGPPPVDEYRSKVDETDTAVTLGRSEVIIMMTIIIHIVLVI